MVGKTGARKVLCYMNVGISERIGVFFEKGSKLKKERNSGFSLCHSFYDITISVP